MKISHTNFKVHQVTNPPASAIPEAPWNQVSSPVASEVSAVLSFPSNVPTVP